MIGYLNNGQTASDTDLFQFGTYTNMPVLDPTSLKKLEWIAVERVYLSTPSSLRGKDLSNSMLAGHLEIYFPSDESLEFVDREAKKLGIKLRRSEMECLALALEMEEEIWTDVERVRKVAEELGIKWRSGL